jgi:ubiquitin-conjugating enzyme E2 Z
MKVNRVLKELASLKKETNEFLVDYDEADITKLNVIIKAPVDSLYKHTFVRIEMTLPENYPFVPPKVKFYNWKNTRIHPNLYGCGKVCLSILGTWSGEPWASTMTLETVIRVIGSLLDNTPYIHEPNCVNDPTYNKYVRFETFDTLLFDYIKHEQNNKFKKFMLDYINENKQTILNDLILLNNENKRQNIHTKYGMITIIDYTKYINQLIIHINYWKTG